MIGFQFSWDDQLMLAVDSPLPFQKHPFPSNQGLNQNRLKNMGPSWHPQVRKPYPHDSSPNFGMGRILPIQTTKLSAPDSMICCLIGGTSSQCAAGNKQARKPPASSWLNHKQSPTSLGFRTGPETLNLCSKLLPKWIVHSSLNFCRSQKIVLDHKLHLFLKSLVPWPLGYGSKLCHIFQNCW